MLCVAFMEPSGNLISSPTEPWRDEAKETRESRSRTPTRPGVPGSGPTSLSGSSGAVGGIGGSGGSSDNLGSDNQYSVMVSEKQARVVSLPSQTCLYRVNLAPADQTFVITANVVSLKGKSKKKTVGSSQLSLREGFTNPVFFLICRWTLPGHVLFHRPCSGLQSAKSSTPHGCGILSAGGPQLPDEPT